MQTVSLEWQGDFRFLARAGEAATVIDGDGQSGPSPVNAFLESVAACAAADVVDILRKSRQDVRGLSVVVKAERRAEPPRYVRKLEMHFLVSGPVDPSKAQRAVDLSFEKYCSVFHTLRMDIALDVDVKVVEEGTGSPLGAGEAAAGAG